MAEVNWGRFSSGLIRFAVKATRSGAHSLLLKAQSMHLVSPTSLISAKVSTMNQPLPSMTARPSARFSVRFLAALAAILACVSLVSVPGFAQQMETVDPDLVIDGDLNPGENWDAGDSWISPTTTTNSTGTTGAQSELPSSRYDTPVLDLPPETPQQTSQQPTVFENGNTYAEDDLIGAAEGLFGQGAEGLARLIEGILKDQGEPNGYIVGREGGGAFVVGVRYGSGTLHHKVEGNMPVYWTGPSIGLDAGANAANTFVLVYNLNDTDELYKRYPAGEGQAYFIGGFNASYMRRGNVVLIPIRVGAGVRLGINAGYMRFSRKQRWLPF